MFSCTTAYIHNTIKAHVTNPESWNLAVSHTAGHGIYHSLQTQCVHNRDLCSLPSSTPVTRSTQSTTLQRIYYHPTNLAWEAGITQLVYRLGYRLDVWETVVRFPAVKRDSSRLSKPDLGHKQPSIQWVPGISFSRGEATAAWSLSLPSNAEDKNELSYNSSPPYALMSFTGTPAALPIIYTYASQQASSIFDQIPVCTVHLLCASL